MVKVMMLFILHSETEARTVSHLTQLMELFVTKENGFQPLSIAVKITILDLAGFLDLTHLKIKSIDYIAI